ncbi:MAG: hypothetical protein EZS28_012771 [Streblomastix strix]|uniref:Uncharacterized protein n=1 Tax=Streblomastix strix TaxID=222440 RepID=A0A5J4W9V7_9EUKA|nr:MAG: hypothetical protein EZS28_012771 [Streblomastix strix]
MIPNTLHSLTKLCRYEQNIHLNEEQDQYSQEIRRWSKVYLTTIQFYGDESDQSELAAVGYANTMIISLSTAGGCGEQGDFEIYLGLFYISHIFVDFYKGRNTYV